MFPIKDIYHIKKIAKNTHCVLSVNAALVIEAGRLRPLVILLHCLFLITCNNLNKNLRLRMNLSNIHSHNKNQENWSEPQCWQLIRGVTCYPVPLRKSPISLEFVGIFFRMIVKGIDREDFIWSPRITYVQYSGGCAVQQRDILQPLYWTYSAVLMVSLRVTDGIPPLYWWYPSTVLIISLRCTVQPPLYCTTTPVLHNHRCTAHTLSGVSNAGPTKFDRLARA